MVVEQLFCRKKRESESFEWALKRLAVVWRMSVRLLEKFGQLEIDLIEKLVEIRRRKVVFLIH